MRNSLIQSTDMDESQQAHHGQTGSELLSLNSQKQKFLPFSLQELLTVYQNNGEKWRAMSTIKVIQAVKKHPREITTLEVSLLYPKTFRLVGVTGP